MSSESPHPPAAEAAQAVTEAPVVVADAVVDRPATAVVMSRAGLWALVLVAGVSLLSSGLLWQKLSAIQENLARQSADSSANAIEARALARQAQDLARENASRQAVLESRLSEVSLQRSQLEDLMQSLTRSRDENLVVDIESAVRLAQQQAQLTGSVEPLLASLRSADQRLVRAAQPRLARLRAAIGRDIDRIKSTSVVDTPGLLARIDDLVRQVDDLPAVNAVATAGTSAARRHEALAPSTWWQKGLALVAEEARGLVRVSRVDQPEAVLLAPEQVFFLRENLKLKLLNARLGLLARQTESARSDLALAAAALNRYFDPAARKTQVAAGLLQQTQAQVRAVELPRIDETLAALATAAAGR